MAVKRVVLEKRLSVSEVERHWITLPSEHVLDFPPADISFQIRVGNQSFGARLDFYRRLHVNSAAFGKLDLGVGSTVVVEKGSNGQNSLRRMGWG